MGCRSAATLGATPEAERIISLRSTPLGSGLGGVTAGGALGTGDASTGFGAGSGKWSGVGLVAMTEGPAGAGLSNAGSAVLS